MFSGQDDFTNKESTTTIFTEEVPKTPKEIEAYARRIAREKRISEDLFIKIMLAESGASSTIVGDKNIICRKGINTGKPVWARGVFQITRCHHPEITDEQAFDPVFSINWAAEKFQQGRVDIWTSWRLIK